MKLSWKDVLAAVAFALPLAAAAQPYPSKPIRFVVGFPPGSSIDVVSRIVLDDVRARTNAIVVVDNRPGALGALGIEAVELAPADGYTLMPSSSATHSSGPHLSRAVQKLDPTGKLAHLGRMTRFDVAVVTSSGGPYKSGRALIDAAKAKPDALTYGFGSGTGQVGGAAFSSAAGTAMRPIPYKGQPGAITDLLGGQVDFVASDLGALLAFLQQGKLTAVAVLADQRSPFLPDVPTTREIGAKPVSLGGWIGVDGPVGLPADIAAWWQEQLRLSLAVPAVQEKLRTIGMEPAPLFGPEFVRFVQNERDRWGAHVKAAGIEPE